MGEKKVRGVGRRLRQFRRRFGQAEPLNLAILANYHRDYTRIGLAPWRGLSYASNPPRQLQQAVVNGLLTTYQHWQAELARYSEPFHLAVWVFELEFRESGVQAAIGEQKVRYERFFGEPVAPQPPLPALISGAPGAEQLRWRAYDNYYPAFCTSDWVTPAGLARYLCGRRYFTVAQPDGDTLYWLHRGLVWVGTACLQPQQGA